MPVGAKKFKKNLNPAFVGCIFKQALRQVYEGVGGGGGLSETSFRIKCFKMKTLHLVRFHFKMLKVNDSGRENCSYFAFTFFFITCFLLNRLYLVNGF